MINPSANIMVGHTLDGLKTLPDCSIHCAVTSPPYFGLRDYGMDGQMGLEESPAQYVAGMVEVFREVKRVLRDDGTLWLNIGDTYTSDKTGNTNGIGGGGNPTGFVQQKSGVNEQQFKKTIPQGFKRKELIGIPWRLAFALQDDGWYLRQDIIWHKPAPMPESVRDRCTKAHEYLFLLTKSPRYYYDAEAIAEISKGREVFGNSRVLNHDDRRDCDRQNLEKTQTRNRRSVWKVSTRSFKGAHFATFPPDLVEPCILAGTSEKGCCSNCGAPMVRETRKTKTFQSGSGKSGNPIVGKQDLSASATNSTPDIRKGPCVSVETTGWIHSCQCEADLEPCKVLDPFSGSGTTGAVANVLGRSYVGMELNPEYAGMWDDRLEDVRKWWAKKNGRAVKKRERNPLQTNFLGEP